MTLRIDLFWIIAVCLLPWSFQERLRPIVKSSTPSHYNSITQQISTQLECTYPADHQCPIDWVINQKKISSSKGVFNISRSSNCESKLITVLGKNTYDAYSALYQCAVTTPEGNTVYSEPVTPRIEIPLISDAKTVIVNDVTENVTVKFSCPSQTNITSLENLPISNKNIRVQWYKDTLPLPANSHKYHHTHGMYLIINNFSTNDLGVYKCFLLGYGILLPAQNKSSVTVVLGTNMKPPALEEQSNGAASVNVIAGATAGSAVALVIICIIVLFYARKKRVSAKYSVQETGTHDSVTGPQWHRDLALQGKPLRKTTTVEQPKN
ncbi:uncharacterized protein [Oscarella lobularis]|uniref:uncharacterized protein n=1 Tax=Oscarella lobularis TaxID=121494 RepID=UPI003313BBD7